MDPWDSTEDWRGSNENNRLWHFLWNCQTKSHTVEHKRVVIRQMGTWRCVVSYHSNAHAQPLSGVTGLSIYLSAVPFSSLCVRIERALARLSKMTTDTPKHTKTIKMAHAPSEDSE